MSAAAQRSSAEVSTQPPDSVNDEPEGSIELGSEDSDSEYDEELSDDSTDGGVALPAEEYGAKDHNGADEDNNGEEDHVSEGGEPNYGQLVDGGRGYIHPDGRQEIWYHQKVSGNPDAPGWTTLNSGPRGPPAPISQWSTQEEKVTKLVIPIPVSGDELAIAVCATEEDLEALDHNRGYPCTCISTNVSRSLYDLPYFDHDHGWWVDPGARVPQRTMQPFNASKTRPSPEKKRKSAAGNETTASSSAAGPARKPHMALSSEVAVPKCDKHFPITGVLEDDWKFIAGSRFIKKHVQDYLAFEESHYGAASDSEDGDNGINAAGEGNNSAKDDNTASDDHRITAAHTTSVSEGVTATTAAQDSKAAPQPTPEESSIVDHPADEEDAPTYIQYIDQAYRLRLIEEDDVAGYRRMNIHTLPETWDDATTIAKLNRWLYQFRLRSRLRAAKAKATKGKGRSVPPDSTEEDAHSSSDSSPDDNAPTSGAGAPAPAQSRPAAAQPPTAPHPAPTAPSSGCPSSSAPSRTSSAMAVINGGGRAAAAATTATPGTAGLTSATGTPMTTIRAIPFRPIAPAPAAAKTATPGPMTATGGTTATTTTATAFPPTALFPAPHPSFFPAPPPRPAAAAANVAAPGPSRREHPRNQWSQTELTAIRNNIARQLKEREARDGPAAIRGRAGVRHKGLYRVDEVLAELLGRWPERFRTKGAVAVIIMRKGLVGQAEEIVAVGSARAGQGVVAGAGQAAVAGASQAAQTGDVGDGQGEGEGGESNGAVKVQGDEGGMEVGLDEKAEDADGEDSDEETE